MEYKNKWKPNSLNKEFWDEVIVGKKIASIEYGEKGMNALVLDSGEKLFFHEKNPLFIFIGQT